MDISWSHTKQALESYKDILRCEKCREIATTPTRYIICGHLFCKACSDTDSTCTKCGSSVKPTEKQYDCTLESLIRYCNSIEDIIGNRDTSIVLNTSTISSVKEPTTPRKSPKKGSSSTLKKYSARNIDKKNPKGETLLHAACIKGDEDHVKHLLDKGANPNTKDYSQWTPLQEAVSLGFYDICKMLLEAGALPDTPGYENKTALHEAVKENRLEEAMLLLQFQANKEVFDEAGKKPIDYCHSEEMLRILTKDNMEWQDLNKSGLNNSLNKSISVANAQFIILASNLHVGSLNSLKMVSSKHKIKIVQTFRASVTHIIVEVNDQNIVKLSYDIMLAILSGKWILNTQWISACLELDDLPDMDLELFEVFLPRNTYTPKIARLNTEKQNPRLFNNCFFYFFLQSNAIYHIGDIQFTKESLSILITEGEGHVLAREPNPEDIKDMARIIPFHVADKPIHPLHRCTHYIIYVPQKDEPRVKYNMPHIKTLPLVWLIECIEKFTLIDPSFLGVA